MPRSRRTSFACTLSCLSLILAGVATAGAVQAEPSPGAALPRVCARPAGHEDGSHTTVSFQLADVTTVEGALTIPCEVQIGAALEQPQARLYIYDGQGNALFEGRSELDGDQGRFHPAFAWPLENVNDEIYRARLEVVHALNQPWHGARFISRNGPGNAFGAHGRAERPGRPGPESIRAPRDRGARLRVPARDHRVGRAPPGGSPASGGRLAAGRRAHRVRCDVVRFRARPVDLRFSDPRTGRAGADALRHIAGHPRRRLLCLRIRTGVPVRVPRSRRQPALPRPA